MDRANKKEEGNITIIKQAGGECLGLVQKRASEIIKRKTD